MPWFGPYNTGPYNNAPYADGICDATSGRPLFQRIDIDTPPLDSVWQVKKLGAQIYRNQSPSVARMALYSDGGTGTLKNGISEVIVSGVYDDQTYAEQLMAEIPVPTTDLDASETIFHVGFKSEGADLNSTDTVGFYIWDLLEPLVEGARRSTCQSWTEWPSPWNTFTPSLTWDGTTFRSIIVGFYVEAFSQFQNDINADVIYPALIADGTVTASILNRAQVEFPKLLLDAAGASLLDFQSIRRGRPVRYRAILSASGMPDYTLLINNIAMTLRQAPRYSLIRVSIPEMLTHADEISARSSGTLTIYQVTESGSSALASADIDAVRRYVGSTARTGVIDARRQLSFTSTQFLDNFIPRNVNASRGRIRYRCSPYPIFPGDLIKVGSLIQTVSSVTLNVSDTAREMEIVVGS